MAIIYKSVYIVFFSTIGMSDNALFSMSFYLLFFLFAFRQPESQTSFNKCPKDLFGILKSFVIEKKKEENKRKKII